MTWRLERVDGGRDHVLHGVREDSGGGSSSVGDWQEAGPGQRAVGGGGDFSGKRRNQLFGGGAPHKDYEILPMLYYYVITVRTRHGGDPDCVANNGTPGSPDELLLLLLLLHSCPLYARVSCLRRKVCARIAVVVRACALCTRVRVRSLWAEEGGGRAYAKGQSVSERQRSIDPWARRPSAHRFREPPTFRTRNAVAHITSRRFVAIRIFEIRGAHVTSDPSSHYFLLHLTRTSIAIPEFPYVLKWDG